MPTETVPGGQEVNNNPDTTPQTPFVPETPQPEVPTPGFPPIETTPPQETSFIPGAPPIDISHAGYPPVYNQDGQPFHEAETPLPTGVPFTYGSPQTTNPTVDHPLAEYPAGAEITHAPFDYTNKVRLSQNDADAVDKQLAIVAVNDSRVLNHYKQNLLKGINFDNLDGQYADLLRRILKARGMGGAYDGGL